MQLLIRRLLDACPRGSRVGDQPFERLVGQRAVGIGGNLRQRVFDVRELRFESRQSVV